MKKEEIISKISLFKNQLAELEKAVLNSGSDRPITERVKSFENACDVLGLSVEEIIHERDTADEAAYKKIKVIVSALNEGWTPDWNNSNERKYYPWFWMDDAHTSGSGFSYLGYVFDDSGSTVGSRLVFKSEALAKFAATQFELIYKDFFKS